MIRVILIRHGRTAWNTTEVTGERFRGLLDLPLAPEGVAQARSTASRLAEIPLAAVYSSPLQRALRTARLIAEPHGLGVHPAPGLTSVDYGDWGGRAHADVVRLWPDLYQRWRHNPFDVEFPAGGSTRKLRDRARAALNDLVAGHSDGDTIALVSHQIVTRTLTCSLLGLPDTSYWHLRQDLCNLTTFGYDEINDKFKLVALNDACHLSRALPQVKGPGTRLIVLRHGQTAWNQGAGEERFRGRTDLPLDPIGQDQARTVSARLQDQQVAAIYTSPLVRTQQTIAPLAAYHSLPMQTHDGLLDINYGRLQGMTHTAARAAYPSLYAQWRSTPGRVSFPHGERLADVQARLVRLLDEILDRHPGQTVALVGHQIVNKILACTILGLSLDQIWRIGQETAALNVFQWAPHGWLSLCINDTCLLPVAK